MKHLRSPAAGTLQTGFRRRAISTPGVRRGRIRGTGAGTRRDGYVTGPGGASGRSTGASGNPGVKDRAGGPAGSAPLSRRGAR